MYRYKTSSEKGAAKPEEEKSQEDSPDKSVVKERSSMAAQAKKLRNIVVGMTMDLYAQNALEYYKEEIYRPGDRVILVYCHKAVDVLPSAAIPKADLPNVGRQEAQRIENSKKILEDRLKKLSLDGEVMVYLQEDPMTKLTEVAEEKKARLIVIGSRNLGPELGKLLHSQGSGIVEKSNIPILVWKPGLFE